MVRFYRARDRSSATTATAPDIRFGYPAASSPADYWWTAALSAALFVVSLFAAFPELDIYVSGLFHDPAEGFILRNNVLVTGINANLKLGLEVFGIFTLAMCLLGLTARFRRQARTWLFFFISITLGPGIIVNLILKANVGRARPRNVQDFGGDHLFTPILQVTNQCAKNCSFSSGEVAMTSTVVFAFLAVIWARLSARGRVAWALAGGAVIALSAVLRIGLGAHFLSDALASIVISALVVLLAWRVTAMSGSRAE